MSDDINHRARDLRPLLYPELETEALSSLVWRKVEEAGYSLRGVEPSTLRVGDRSASVSCAALERLFLFELWAKGVCYGSARTGDPSAMGNALGAFVVDRASVEEMGRRFPWVSFHRVARAHERGELTEQTWLWRLERDDEIARVLRPLIQACARRPRLRALFPFTSHEALHFSRTTGYPYETMPVCAIPAPRAGGGPTFASHFAPGVFRVVRRLGIEDGASHGEGDADWAAEMLESQIPTGWQRAVDGTAECAEN